MKKRICYAPSIHSTDFDANGFYAFNTKGFGGSSFGLMAPDGTGIGHFLFADDASVWKFGIYMVDNDSAYDGMYSDNFSFEADQYDKYSKMPWDWWYVSHDSFKGIISSTPVAVDDDAPAAFAVAQNSPNPFNPTTTISFSTTEAGNVSIDVFNVAGQKVDTISNEFMSMGNHTVTWNASGFSAGVYFYTVKSGEFSKTMKMTLLK